jgi:hypothetical protein
LRRLGTSTLSVSQPNLLQNISLRAPLTRGTVFACLTVVSIVVIYFMYPETKGKSLEELAELFGDPVVVHLTDATEEQKHDLDMEIKNELIAERREEVKA